MKFLATALAASLLLSAAAPAFAQCIEGCEGQGHATLLMRGKCDLGSSVKFRLGGAVRAPYKLLKDFGAGPTEIEGVGTFCLDFGPNFGKVKAGRLNNRGFGSVRTNVPDDPNLVGQLLAFQMGVKDNSAPNGVAISNGIFIELCSEGTGGRACVPCDAEGCTPGYWKNHPGSWAETAFLPDDLVADVFEKPECLVDCEPSYEEMTLIEALDLEGGMGTCGGSRILLRAAVASLLNASHPGVAFVRTAEEVLEVVDAALATCDRPTMITLGNELDSENNFGCPLGRDASDGGGGGEGEGCETGIIKIGTIHPAFYEGEFPVEITSFACATEDPQAVIGEVSFEYDPDNPPAFPITAPGIIVTKVSVHTGVVVVHTTFDATDFGEGKFPGMTTFKVTVGDVVSEREVDTSCDTPIGIGSKFNPVFVAQIIVVE